MFLRFIPLRVIPVKYLPRIKNLIIYTIFYYKKLSYDIPEKCNFSSSLFEQLFTDVGGPTSLCEKKNVFGDLFSFLLNMIMVPGFIRNS